MFNHALTKLKIILNNINSFWLLKKHIKHVSVWDNIDISRMIINFLIL